MLAKYISWFKDLTINDIPSVGGKNASLGEMYAKLKSKGVPVPNGFALTADAYWFFLRANKLDKKIKETLKGLNKKDIKELSRVGDKIRKMILAATFPKDIEKEIRKAYRELCVSSKKKNVDVAVRSSATAEDLPDASFAGQQETYLNVRGEEACLSASKKCIASLFTDRAISYREDKGFDHTAIALSVGVQEMVRSDVGASGVMFTLDTESGFKGVVLINAAYGLGEYVVKGQVIPDQFYIFKEGLKNGYKSIISKRLGSKEVKLVYGSPAPLTKGGRRGLPSSAMDISSRRQTPPNLPLERGGGGTKQEKVKMADQKKYCLTNDEVLQLAKWGVIIENHYGHPMDMEWAKDGVSGKLFIVQARSETVQSRVKVNVIEQYQLKQKGKVLLTGSSVGQKIGQGRARVINSPKQMKQFKPGEVLITRITDPDWEPIMRMASAIVTEQGGKTSHAAIVSRELGTPCIVGAAKARQVVANGEEVTVSCAEGEVGYVYKGLLPFEVHKTEIKNVLPTHTKIMMNVGDPDSAFSLSNIPNDGVGLAREEFIFTNFVKIHPLALVHYKDQSKEVKEKIDALTVGYKDKAKYCADKLAEGIAFITSAFSPNDVIVRLSDFKTNEYATLVGGEAYEPKEENPMLGWRGASRYYDEKYKPGFKLECEAIKKVRNEWGMKNLIVMVPFCRTVEEGRKVLATMKEFGLERGKNGLKVYVMCEIPSNVILAKEFCEIFDGFSIGSNDLTQLTLGVDRDSALVSHVYDEKNEAVKILIRQVIKVAHENHRKVGICGQAPSDYPEFAEFLVQEGIDSISLNPDTVLKTRERIAAMEKKVAVKPNKILKIAGATKMLLIFGVLGLVTALGGYTCQTVSGNQVSQKDLQIEVENKIAFAKSDLRREMTEEFENKLTQQKSIYNEDSFVKFSLNYPSGWAVSHIDNEIRFSSLDKTKWFSILEKSALAVILPDEFVTSAWNGYPVRSFEIINNGVWEKTILVYPNGYKKSKTAIKIFGSKDEFDDLAGAFADFKINKY
ncbi:MAG: Phosphoenolpyruvate synthase [Candidatus Magasanikbacteria bacterium GW2011_GWA2_40_10]|uniref:Phosphoenolpyruvate synthase n=1 Tax=Candidatus Magasanikbacteria bacterium GW2011_GWA2_40_10 TaxID=1619037 RepID=A0A0G0T958_9BACT|nr:MAG: Phosphoenolpyruvate synthase [Candidatus Magasanikbacteria bacterium GW2011_GWA2_40_10]